MLSVLTTAALPVERCTVPDDHSFNELSSAHDALELYAKLLSRSGGSVRLHCTVPTWCPDGDECGDLHDLHELRSRFLVFVGELMQSLRSSGIPASYRLAPSSSTCCLVCALPPNLDAYQVKHDATEAVAHAKYSRQKVLLADLKSGPALIIT